MVRNLWIRKRIEAGSRHKKALAASETIVPTQWNVGLYDIITNKPFTKTISESLAKRLAQLALVLPLHDARAEIEKAIAYRMVTTTSPLNYVFDRDIDRILSRFPKGQINPNREKIASRITQLAFCTSYSAVQLTHSPN